MTVKGLFFLEQLYHVGNYLKEICFYFLQCYFSCIGLHSTCCIAFLPVLYCELRKLETINWKSL